MKSIPGVLYVVLAALGKPLPVLAGPLPEPYWYSIRFNDMAFSAEEIGFVSTEGGHYAMPRGRSASELQAVDLARFQKRFPGYKPRDKSSDDDHHGQSELTASDGTVYGVRHPYCAEGSEDTHALTANGSPVPDHADPCADITAIESTGNQLWLGLTGIGEGGHYPLEGPPVIVQSRGGKRLLGAVEGVPGGMVAAIRADPFDRGAVWVATEWGVAAVRRDRKVDYVRYLVERFDGASGRLVVELARQKQASDPMAMLARRYAVPDPAGLARAARRVPRTLLESLYSCGDGHCPKLNLQGGRVPAQLNAIVPFLVEAGAAAKDERLLADLVGELCLFRDSRATRFLVDLRTKEKASSDLGRMLDGCLTGVAASPDANELEAVRDLAKSHLGRIRNILGQVRERPVMERLKGNSEAVGLAAAAVALKRMGRPDGFALLADFFRVPGPSHYFLKPRELSVFQEIVRRLNYQGLPRVSHFDVDVFPMVQAALGEILKPGDLDDVCQAMQSGDNAQPGAADPLAAARTLFSAYRLANFGLLSYQLVAVEESHCAKLLRLLLHDDAKRQAFLAEFQFPDQAEQARALLKGH